MGYVAGTKKRIVLNTHNWRIRSERGSHGNQVHQGSFSSNILILYPFYKRQTGVFLGIGLQQDRKKDMKMAAPKSRWKAAADALGSILVLIPTLKTPLSRFPNDSFCLQIPAPPKKKTIDGREGPTMKMS